MGFKHKINESEIPVCNIMRVNIAAINMDWLLEFTNKNINELSGDYMCVSNVHTTVVSYEDNNYCTVQNNAALAIPDGGPIASLVQKRGHSNAKRTTGPDYMKEILKISAEKGWKHYFYGSTEETINKLKITLEEKYKGVQVVGMYSPPFRELTPEEEENVISEINETQPDFIWVGLGAPKQEIWMAEHQGKVKGFMVGVGAAFDYMVGNISRAPEWMQNHNLEWLYRLLQDPKRLFYRYLYTNPKFIWHAIVKGR